MNLNRKSRMAAAIRTSSGRSRLRAIWVTALSSALFCLASVSARAAVSVAAGVYGLYGVPVLQEDAAPGSLYGAKLRADLFGPIGAEAFYTSFQEGDVHFTTPSGTQQISGGTESVIGGNLVFGSTSPAGFRLYLTGGAGSYVFSKGRRAEIRRLGYNAGLGAEIRSVIGLAIDLSARANAVPLAGGGARNFAALQAGINYYFFP